MKPDGGPAFPLPLGTMNEAEPSQSGGMSLRDLYAGMALQGILASPGKWWWKHEDGSKQTIVTQEEYARFAHQLADAMISEGEKP